MAANMASLTGIATLQKGNVLESRKGGYAPVLHDMYRTILPGMVAKYGGRDARDALILLSYLHSYTNGEQEREYFMWAFPTNEQIKADTGIHHDRMRRLKDILKDERLVIIQKVPWRGNIKDMYLPLYYSNESCIRDTADSLQQDAAELVL